MNKYVQLLSQYLLQETVLEERRIFLSNYSWLTHSHNVKDEKTMMLTINPALYYKIDFFDTKLAVEKSKKSLYFNLFWIVPVSIMLFFYSTICFAIFFTFWAGTFVFLLGMQYGEFGTIHKKLCQHDVNYAGFVRTQKEVHFIKKTVKNNIRNKTNML